MGPPSIPPAESKLLTEFLAILLRALGRVASQPLLDAINNYRAQRIAKNKKTHQMAIASSEYKEFLLNYYRDTSPGEIFLGISDQQQIRTRTFPFLTKKNWLPTPDETSLEISTELIPGRWADLEVDERFISAFRDQGHRLDPLPTFTFASIEDDLDEKIIKCGLCTYDQYASLCRRILDEGVREYKKKDPKTLLRDKYASSFDRLLAHNNLPLAIGVATLVVFENPEEPGRRVFLHQRSAEVIGSEGFLSPIPSFAFQPTVASYEDRECDLLHNFYRELCEELFNQSEVRDFDSEYSKHKSLRDYVGRIDYRWFYSYSPIDQLSSDPDKLDFHVVGFGFDGMNCEPNIATVAYIKDFDLLRDLTTQETWETKSGSLRQYSLESEELIDLIFSDSTPGLTALALVGALNLYGVKNQNRIFQTTTK